MGCVYDIDMIRNTLKYKKTPYICSRTQGGHPYYMFLLKIPYSMDYRHSFTSTRNFITKTSIDKKYTEKSDIRWVSLDTIKYTLNGKSIISLRSIFENTLRHHLHEIEDIIKKP